MSILSAERDRYSDVWNSVSDYGNHAPGEARLPMFLDMVGDERGTILDAGTGSGRGALALKAAKFDVYTCDVTQDGMIEAARALPFREACLWHDLRAVANHTGHWGRSKFSFVYCCDVLEHIPPQFTMLAIDQLLRVTRRGLFLSISLVPDNFGAWVGAPLHQTVMPYVWWRDSIRELGEIVESRDLISDGVFFVRPR
jgi:2-polyprenyl-3-methyl-5-hydroxy-6-metoxy-1,4-benzoquinol methylase